MIGERQEDLDWVVSVSFSPDRKLAVFGDTQGTILVRNVVTGEQLVGDWRDIFFPDGEYLASVSDYATAIMWDMARRDMKTGPLKILTGKVRAIHFSLNRSNLVSTSENENIYVWDMSSGEVLRVE